MPAYVRSALSAGWVCIATLATVDPVRWRTICYALGFTEKQGQYLAFIYTYSHMFRRPPAETDMQRHFRVSPPSVHQIVVTLERNGLIRRQPDAPRSIETAHPKLAGVELSELKVPPGR